MLPIDPPKVPQPSRSGVGNKLRYHWQTSCKLKSRNDFGSPMGAGIDQRGQERIWMVARYSFAFPVNVCKYILSGVLFSNREWLTLVHKISLVFVLICAAVLLIATVAIISGLKGQSVSFPLGKHIRYLFMTAMLAGSMMWGALIIHILTRSGW